MDILKELQIGNAHYTFVRAKDDHGYHCILQANYFGEYYSIEIQPGESEIVCGCDGIITITTGNETEQITPPSYGQFCPKLIECI